MDQPSRAAFEAAYAQQIALGRTPVYATAFASKVHEGELFAEHYATLRRRRHEAKEKVALSRGKATANVTKAVQPRKRTIRDFTVSRRLGEGAYSMVYLATEKDTGDEFAVKILDKAFIHKEGKTKYVMTEKEVFSTITSPHVVRLFYTFHDEQKLYFVIEYCKNGELLQWINKLDCFDEECTRFYAAGIVRGLEHMHAANVIHRDLKPENVLLDENMHIKLTDFGTSKILKRKDDTAEVDDKANSFVGTAQYVSPELLTDKIACKSSDYWALGCIIYQLLSGKVPFRAANDYQTFRKIQALEYEVPPGFPEAAKDLVQRLLVLDPKQRLGSESQGGIEAIKSHPFFEGIDWETLHEQDPPKLDAYLPAITPDDKPLHAHDAADDELADIEAAIFMKSMGQIEVVSKEDKDRQQRLAAQKKSSPWQPFVTDNELIIKTGLVDKRKGLFAKRRQLILTDAPRLVYVDPESMERKGEIPWSKELTPQYKNMKTFFVHTPSRTYYLEDVDRTSITWVDTIQKLQRLNKES